jgi:hypothetical protein
LRDTPPKSVHGQGGPSGKGLAHTGFFAQLAIGHGERFSAEGAERQVWSASVYGEARLPMLVLALGSRLTCGYFGWHARKETGEGNSAPKSLQIPLVEDRAHYVLQTTTTEEEVKSH